MSGEQNVNEGTAAISANGRVDRNVRQEPKPAMILRLLTEAQIGVTTNVRVADALEFRRDQYGLTQREFAAILGLQNTHYSEIISGKRRLTLVATKRAFAIGVPAGVLLQPDA